MKPERLTVIFFLGVTIIFMCLTFTGAARRANEKLEIAQKNINTNWEQLYPFDEDDSIVPLSIPIHERAIFSYINHIKAKIEPYTSSKIACRSLAVSAAKRYEELISWNIAVLNGSIRAKRLHDGALSELVDSRDISQNAEAVKKLHTFCHDLDIDFMYINFPGKICISEDEGISGILDFSNQNADRLLAELDTAGVKCYDFRKILHAEGMKHHKAFFVEDVHWRLETGLWAAGKILEILKNDYGWPVNPELLTPDKFKKTIYPKAFNDEDFVLMYPEYPMQVHYEIPSMAIDTIGDFGVMYSSQKHVSYGVYNYSIKPLGKIRNIGLKDNNKSLLIIHDSFANSTIPFLAAGVKNIDELDLRRFSGSVKSYIKTHRPDAVIVCYFINIAGMDEILRFSLIV